MHLWSLPQGKESHIGAAVARLGWAVRPWEYPVWLPFLLDRYGELVGQSVDK